MARIQITAEFNDWFGGLRDKQARQSISVCITRPYYIERVGITHILLCGGDKDCQSRDIERARTLARQR